MIASARPPAFPLTIPSGPALAGLFFCSPLRRSGSGARSPRGIDLHGCRDFVAPIEIPPKRRSPEAPGPVQPGDPRSPRTAPDRRPGHGPEARHRQGSRRVGHQSPLHLPPRSAASSDRPGEAAGFPYWLRGGAKPPRAARKRWGLLLRHCAPLGFHLCHGDQCPSQDVSTAAAN